MANVIRGAKGQVHSIKAGQGAPFGEMRPDFAPSAQRPVDFVDLENVRRVGGNVVNRGGQAPFGNFDDGSGGLGGEVTAMVEQKTAFTARLAVLGGGADHFTAAFFGDADPKVQILSHTNTERAGIIIVTSAGELYNLRTTPGSGSAWTIGLYAARPDNPVSGIGSAAGNGTPDFFDQDELIFALPPHATFPRYTEPGALIEYAPGRLLIPAAGQPFPTTSTVWTWDGTTLTPEVEFLHRTLRCSAVFRDMVVFGNMNYNVGAVPNFITIRSSAGVWSTMAPSSGDVTTGLYGHPYASFRDRLYIPNGRSVLFGSNPDIFIFDGLTLDPITPATTGIDMSTNRTRVIACETHMGNLYYMWMVPDAANTWAEVLKIGKFDGTTWTPGYKDLLAQFPGYLAQATATGPLRSFQGSLWTSMIRSPAVPPGVGGEAVLMRSPGAAVNGAWLEEGVINKTAWGDVPGSPSSSGNVVASQLWGW